ncbi:unnamed protein product, partial [Amoebophrya sp. A25]
SSVDAAVPNNSNQVVEHQDVHLSFSSPQAEAWWRSRYLPGSARGIKTAYFLSAEVEDAPPVFGVEAEVCAPLLDKRKNCSNATLSRNLVGDFDSSLQEQQAAATSTSATGSASTSTLVLLHKDESAGSRTFTTMPRSTTTFPILEGTDTRRYLYYYPDVDKNVQAAGTHQLQDGHTGVVSHSQSSDMGRLPSSAGHNKVAAEEPRSAGERSVDENASKPGAEGQTLSLLAALQSLDGAAKIKLATLASLWFTTAVVNWSLQFMTPRLPGNTFANFIAIGLGKLIGYGSCGPLADSFGRRQTMIVQGVPGYRSFDSGDNK